MPDGALTEMHRDVSLLFFELPESDGFVLAGGAALIAIGLSVRPTSLPGWRNDLSSESS